ncbi:MAG: polysaccharide pyruvyl transferase family protein [Nitrospirota bacterium]
MTLSILSGNWQYVLPSAPKIGYLGWVGHGNLGDEALYLAFQRLFPRHRLLPFKYSAKTVWLEQIMRRKVFVATILGGGTLINKRAILDALRAAQSRYQPSFALGTGVADPVFGMQKRGEPDGLHEWIECLERCRFVGVRGPLSQHLLAQAGYPSAEIVGDTALTFADVTIAPKRGTQLLGVNIGTAYGNVWGDEERILEFVVQLVTTMIGLGYRAVFVPMWDADLPYIQEAVKRINDPGAVSVFRDYHSVEATMQCLRTCDVFVGEKLHSVVLALCANTPSVMLEYQPKCLDFMMSMELERFSIRTDRLSLDAAVDLLDELAANIDAFQQRIAKRAGYFRDLQQRKAADLAATMAQGLAS